MTPKVRFFTFTSMLLLVCIRLTSAHAQNSDTSKSELNAELFYQILLSELSIPYDNGNYAAVQMLATARKAQSEKLYERAIELALRVQDGEGALKAAQAWAHAFPRSRDANRYWLQIVLGLNHVADAIVPVQQGLAMRDPEEKISYLELIPRYFSRANDKEVGASTLEKALLLELSNPRTGPTAWYAIGIVQLLATNTRAALDAAQKGAALNARAESPAVLALDLMDAKVPEAEALVQNYLAQPQPRPAIRMQYARKLLNAQRVDDAKAQIMALTQQAPDYADGWLVRGSLEWQEKKGAVAKTSLQKYIELQQAEGKSSADNHQRSVSNAYFLLAQIAEKEDQFSDAQTYLSYLDQAQDALRVRGLQATILLRQGKLDEARALIQSTPESDANDAQLKLATEIQLLREAKQWIAGYELLEKAVKRFPENLDFTYDLAIAAEKLGKMDEMERLLRQVIASKPDNHQAYNALGYSFADRNVQLGEARKLINKALEFAPQDPYILDSLAWVEFRSGNLQEALRILQAAYRMKTDAEIAAHLGEVLWSLQEKTQARNIWNRALQEQPDNDVLQETIQRLTRP